MEDLPIDVLKGEIIKTLSDEDLVNLMTTNKNLYKILKPIVEKRKQEKIQIIGTLIRKLDNDLDLGLMIHPKIIYFRGDKRVDIHPSLDKRGLLELNRIFRVCSR